MYLDVFFSGFAGALSSFGFSQVPSLHFLSNVYRYVRLTAYLVSRFVSLDLLVLSAVLSSPRFPAYIFCPK